MKKSFLIFWVLFTGISFLCFPGCAREEEKEVGWAIPRFEKKVETKQVYVVKKDDSISIVAEYYDISPLRLAEANGLKLKGPGSIIHPGQKLIIPQE